MSTPRIPSPIREAARSLFLIAATLPRPGVPPPPLPSGVGPDSAGQEAARFFCADPSSGLAPDDEFLKRYLIFAGDETVEPLAGLMAAGEQFTLRAEAFLQAMFERDDDHTAATAADTLPTESLESKLLGWNQEWRLLERWWGLWRGAGEARRGVSAERDEHDVQTLCLSGDQLRAADRLESIWRARQADGRAGSLPRSILARWTHPMMVGPAGAGKAFTAQAVAQRLGLAFTRYDIGAWSTVANRSGRATLDFIEQFRHSHPAGVMIYLAGVDALSSTRLGGDRGDVNTSWWGSVNSELQSFLDSTSTRIPTGENGLPRPMVVLGGRFSTVWGERDVGGPSGADAWQMADGEALKEPQAVAEWLAQHGGLPAGLAHRISSVPLIVARPDPKEAAALVAAMMATLPPAMDGVLEVGALTTALMSPAGWRAVTHLVEEGLAGC